MNNKKKTNKKSKRNEILMNKKIIIGIGVIVILFTMLFLIKPKKNKSLENSDMEKVELGNFEKMAVYEVIEDKYLKDGLLYLLNGNSETNLEEAKYLYAIEKSLNNNETTTLANVISEYENVFGEQIREDKKNEIIRVATEKVQYEYNPEEKTIEKRKVENNEKEIDRMYYYVIKDLYTANGYYQIDVEIRYINTHEIDNYFTSYDFSEKNTHEEAERIMAQIQNEKNNYSELYKIYSKEINEINKDIYTKPIGTGTIILRIDGDKYYLEKYIENQ